MKISPFEMIFIIRDLMASITPIKRKRILVTKSPFRWGVTYKGNQIRSTVRWAPEPDMTKRQIEKEVKRLVYEFEREIKLGFQADDRQTFAKYAEYVLDSVYSS